jgi:uncharacterized protein (DUF433 family)
MTPVSPSPDSPLDRAIYSFADVDRLVGLPAGTARRWLQGYGRGGRDYPPVLRTEPTGPETVTWGELVETRLLAEFRSQRVSLQRLRPAVERLRQEFGTYPLAHARPLLDAEGRELVRRVQDEVSLDRHLQLVVVRNGQLVLTDGAERFTDALNFTEDIASALRPRPETPEVRMDPAKAFGQPAVRSVRTDVVAEAYRAGEPRDSIAALFDLSLDQVEQALRYEMIAAAARIA